MSVSFWLFFGNDPYFLQKAIKTHTISTFTLLAFAILTFVCGVNILNGANWARWLYTGYCVCLFIFDLIFFSHIADQFGLGHFVLSAFVHGIVIFFLFLPKANDFFSSH